MEYRSALCASRGYASLSLAYIGHKDIPGPTNRMNVGDSYFRVGCRFLHYLRCPLIILLFLQNISCFVLFCFLDSQHSIYFRIILRSALTESGSSASPLGCTWLFELPLSLISMYVCLCKRFIHSHSLEKHSICKYITCES